MRKYSHFFKFLEDRGLRGISGANGDIIYLDMPDNVQLDARDRDYLNKMDVIFTEYGWELYV